MTSQGNRPTDEPLCEGYECPDGWFEVRDDDGPHRWIATRDPVTVRR